MAIIERDINKSVFVDKDEIRRLVVEVNARIGFVPDPTATVQKVRAMIQAEGLHPKDDAFITEIMRRRYEKNERSN